MNKKTAKKIVEITKKTYEYIGADFAETRSKPWPEMENLVAKYVRDGQKVLDLGCGNGRIIEALRGKRIDYFGVDGSVALVNEARKKCENFEVRQMGDMKIKYLDLLELEKLEEGDFDVVFLFASFNHIPSAELRTKVLGAIFKLLKKDGHIVMTNWNLWQLGLKKRKNIWNYKFPITKEDRKQKAYNEVMVKIDLGKSMHELGLRDVITCWRSRDGKKKSAFLYYRVFTKRELRNLFRKSGFKVIENYYSFKGSNSYVWKGRNIVTVGKKIG